MAVISPVSRTSPARSRLPSAAETVGFDIPVTLASSAREAAPEARRRSSSTRSLFTRRVRLLHGRLGSSEVRAVVMGGI